MFGLQINNITHNLAFGEMLSLTTMGCYNALNRVCSCAISPYKRCIYSVFLSPGSFRVSRFHCGRAPEATNRNIGDHW